MVDCINGGRDNNSQRQQPWSLFGLRDVKLISVFLTVTALLALAVYHSKPSVQQLRQLFSLPASASASILIPTQSDSYKTNTNMVKDVGALERVLLEASTEEKTVILTTLNRAWAEPNSTFDLFLEGFHVGVGTKRLLRHLVVVCMDEDAYARCLEIHPRRCYSLKTPGIDFSGQKNFMTPDYLKMMWRRLEFLGSILELGYNFLFTDMDILWLRDPFPHLFTEVDFQVACDRSNGNSSDPAGNSVNAGFKFVQANHRTVKFYKYWNELRWTFCGKNEQDVFNIIKHDRFVTEELGLTMRFLDTVHFRGFCQLHREMEKICILHANCCLGLHNKINDLRQALQDWKDYLSATDHRNVTWRSLDRCKGSMSNISLIV